MSQMGVARYSVYSISGLSCLAGGWIYWCFEDNKISVSVQQRRLKCYTKLSAIYS